MVTAPSRPLLRRPVVLVVLALAVVLAVVALALFQPWKLVVDEFVDEAAPGVAPAAVPTAPADPTEPVAAAPAVPAEPAAAEPPAGPVVLARGGFVSHEHTTSGSVAVLQLADGSRVLRLEDLRTSNGPALKVWITDAPVLPGRAGWGVFDDGRWVDLGDLKGNVGSANHPLPAEVDLAELTSVSVWCERFSVSFGAAELVPV